MGGAREVPLPLPLEIDDLIPLLSNLWWLSNVHVHVPTIIQIIKFNHWLMKRVYHILNCYRVTQFNVWCIKSKTLPLQGNKIYNLGYNNTNCI